MSIRETDIIEIKTNNEFLHIVYCNEKFIGSIEKMPYFTAYEASALLKENTNCSNSWDSLETAKDELEKLTGHKSEKLMRNRISIWQLSHGGFKFYYEYKGQHMYLGDIDPIGYKPSPIMRREMPTVRNLTWDTLDEARECLAEHFERLRK